MRVVIVIPTYNEIENIKKLIPELASEFKKYPEYDFHILVVDDTSPDGTYKVVKELEEQTSFVHLLLGEEKKGLGDAYIRGFKYAMEALNPDIIVEMDADFQHDPKDVIRLVEPIKEEGFDYVIGSRFTKGGSIPKDWEFYRKFLSVGGNILSKIILGIFSVNDFTTGFKASRVHGFVDKLDLDNLLSKGFAYKIDLLYRMHKLKAKIKEIPITFGLRGEGESKMARNNPFDSLKVVLLLRANDIPVVKNIVKNKNFLKFCVVGGIGFLVDGGSFNLLRLIPAVGSVYASAIAGFLGMLTTFILNNYWSFGDRTLGEGKKKKIKSTIIYFISSYIPILFRSKLVDWAIAWLGDTFIVSNTAFLIGIIIGLIWNFTVYSRIIWKGKK